MKPEQVEKLKAAITLGRNLGANAFASQLAAVEFMVAGRERTPEDLQVIREFAVAFFTQQFFECLAIAPHAEQYLVEALEHARSSQKNDTTVDDLLKKYA